jgi:hypothetical protein
VEKTEHLNCVKNSGNMKYDDVFLGEWFGLPATQYHIPEELYLQKTPLKVKSCTEALNSTIVFFATKRLHMQLIKIWASDERKVKKMHLKSM